MKNAIIVGASSGIGRELAKILAEEGYQVGILARRVEMLLSLQSEIPSKTFVKYLDIAQTEEAIQTIESLILEMGGLDLFVISSGVAYENKALELDKELETIDINVRGFCALANIAYKMFANQGHGHIVGLSSVIALRGWDIAPAYSASKAFISNYLEALRKKAYKTKKNIIITDIQPGYVKTDILRGGGYFWVASAHKAAQQIYEAIRKKKRHAYITKRWRLMGWVLKTTPRPLYDRIR